MDPLTTTSTASWQLKFLCFALIFGIIGCASLPKPQIESDKHTLRIVTYNVNFGSPNPENVADYLLDCGADVICLQETHLNWEIFLKNRLSKLYPHSSFKTANGAGGIAFMSKHKLSNVKSIEAKAGWFPALRAHVTTEIGLVQILNVHLRPPLSDSGSVTLSSYYQSPEIHRRELEHFLKDSDQSIPLIIAGDFNENEHRKGIKGLLENGFTDALSLYDKRSRTWDWRVMPGITLKNRYDHIVFKGPLDCIGAWVDEVDASDHHPVTAIFTPSMIQNL